MLFCALIILSQKNFLKNHKFWSKIDFLLKKGWFEALPRPPKQWNLHIRKIQTFLVRNWKYQPLITSGKKSGALWKFSFFQKKNIFCQFFIFSGLFRFSKVLYGQIMYVRVIFVHLRSQGSLWSRWNKNWICWRMVFKLS